MDFAIEKYYPMMIRTIAFTILMAIFSLTILHTSGYSSTKEGGVVVEIGIVYAFHTIIVFFIIIFFKKYAIYAISTYPLAIFILYTRICTHDDTLIMNEWSMGFVGTVFSRSSTCK